MRGHRGVLGSMAKGHILYMPQFAKTLHAFKKNGSFIVILGANWFAKLYSAMFAMDSRFRGNDSD